MSTPEKKKPSAPNRGSAKNSKSKLTGKIRDSAQTRQVHASGDLLLLIAKTVSRPGVKLRRKRKGVPSFSADPEDSRRIVRNLDGRKVRGRFVRGKFTPG